MDVWEKAVTVAIALSAVRSLADLMFYKQKRRVVHAVQWMRMGDHPFVQPGIREGTGTLDAKVTAPYSPRHVEPTDWIVAAGSTGLLVVMTDDEFKTLFESI